MQAKTSFLFALFLVLFFQTVAVSQALAKADAGPDQTVNEGETVILDGSNSSLPGLIIGYIWQQTGGSPKVTLNNANKAKASFTAPQVGPAGTSLTFQLTVIYFVYSSIFSDADTTSISVLFVNHPPVADAGPNQTIDEGSAVTLNGSNSFDPDFGDSITYQWLQTGGTPTVTLNGANTATPTFTAPNVGPGGTSLTFELTVTDLGGLEDSDTTVINVSFVNQPPLADAGPNQTREEETKVTLNGSNSSDPDDGIKSYRWRQTAGPAVRLSNDEAIKPTFTAPNVAGSKSLTFELTVTDFGGLKDTDTTIVNVTGDNDPPTADAGSDQAKEEEIEVTLNGSNSSDPDDGIKSYQWSQKTGPPVTLSNPQAKKPTLKTPNVVGSKSLTFELTVTDFGGLKDTDTTIVNVTGDNDPPTADAGPDQTVDEEEAIVELDGAGSIDPDDGIKSYRWRQKTGPLVTLSNPLDVQPIFTPPNVLENGASLTFELTVMDIGGLENVDATIVNVTGDNDPPTANAGSDQRVLENSSVTLDGSNSFDTDDGIASYRWKQVAGQSVTLSDPTDDQPTFEAPSFDDSGDKPLVFELIVTDDGGLQSSDSTTVSVSNYEKDNPGASGGGCFIDTAANEFRKAKYLVMEVSTTYSPLLPLRYSR